MTPNQNEQTFVVECSECGQVKKLSLPIISKAEYKHILKSTNCEKCSQSLETSTHLRME